MRPSIGVYAALAAVDTALATLPGGSPWRRVTKPMLMPALLASLRGSTGQASPSPVPAEWDVADPRAADPGEPQLHEQRGWGSASGALKPAPPSAALRWVRRAVVGSWVGDVALLAPTPGALLAGMAGFWGAHACYVRAFIADGALGWLRDNPYAVGVAAGAGGVVVGALARQAPGFERPVVVYGSTVTAMALCGVATGRPAVRAGVVLFCISDTVLGMGQFAGFKARPLRGLVMATYTLAQGLIAQSYAPQRCAPEVRGA